MGKEEAEPNVYKVVVGDIDKILQIAEECNLSFWTAIDYEKEIDDEKSIFLKVHYKDETIGFISARLINIQNTNLLSQNKSIKNELPEADKTPPDATQQTGYDCEVEILNIAVVKAFQHNGLGQMLIEALVDQLKQFRRAIIWLEVRQSNSQAINFYQKQQFAEVFKRKNYYVQPTENALVFRKEIIKVNADF